MFVKTEYFGQRTRGRPRRCEVTALKKTQSPRTAEEIFGFYKHDSASRLHLYHQIVCPIEDIHKIALFSRMVMMLYMLTRFL